MVSNTKLSPVLFLLGSLEIGGSETKFVNMAIRMAKNGLPVHVAYLQPPEDLKSRLADVPLVHLERKGKWSIRAFKSLARYVDNHEISTIVSVNPYPLTYAVPLASNKRQRKLNVIASINTSEFLSRREKLFMTIYAACLKRCTAIAFGSKSQQESWIRQYHLPASRSRVIYNGVDDRKFDPAAIVKTKIELLRDLNIDEDAFVIVCVSQFRPEKAHTNLLQAMAALRKQRTIYPTLLLVGDGPERNNISKLVDDAELNDSVRFVGVVDDVRPYLKAADLFVLTSIAVETFSNAALEASAMGLPVVISDVGGAREMFPSNDFATVYPRNDVSALTEAIAQFIDDGPPTERRARLIRARIVDNYSVGAMDAEWKDVIWSTSLPQNDDR